MEKKNFDASSAFEEYESFVSDYWQELEKSEFSKSDLNFIKSNILVFLEEFRKNNKNLNIQLINADFINLYLSKLIPKKYPPISKNKVVKIQTTIKKFLHFLSLQGILERQKTREIFNNMYTKTELKRNIQTTNIPQKDTMEKLKSRLITVAENLEDYLENGAIEAELQNYVNLIPVKSLIKALFELFDELEDERQFLNFFTLIFEFLYLPSLPSKTLEYIRNNQLRDRTLFRILLLYRHFELSGYLVEQSSEDLLQTLNLDQNKYKKYMESFQNQILEQLESVEGAKNVQAFEEEILDWEKKINSIKPLKENSPFLNVKNQIKFNLSPDLNMGLLKHINFLKEVSCSEWDTVKFINSGFDDLTRYFSDFEEKQLMDQAWSRYYSGNFRKALFSINKLLKLCPKHAIALYAKGKILGQSGQIAQAIKYFLRSLEIEPYRIELFMDLSQLLQIGGKFHSSLLITTLLLRFCPLDFNLLIQMAFNLYQLRQPFKKYLKAAGLLDSPRLLNFLNRFWIYDRIEPRDNLDDHGITSELFHEFMIFGDFMVSSVIKLLNNTQEEDNPSSRKPMKIKDPCYLFPDEKTHIMKNWFIFEFTDSIISLFRDTLDDQVIDLSDCLDNEDFYNFCFKISKKCTDYLLTNKTYKKSKIISRKPLEAVLNSIRGTRFFKIINFFLSNKEIMNTIYLSLQNFIQFCDGCPNHCLNNPQNRCFMFTDPLYKE